jgi:hypothetical protein
MKKIITSLMALSLMFSASAQTSSGNILLDGSANFMFSSTTDDDTKTKTTDIGLGLMGGYFVIDGLALGLGVSVDNSSVKPDGGDAVKSSSTMIAPFARYYVGDIGVWGQVSYGFGSMKFDGNDLGKNSNLGLAVGYAIFLNDNVSLNPNLGYNMNSFTPDGGDAMKSSGLAGGLTIAVHL